jgi:hypothetical protein
VGSIAPGDGAESFDFFGIHATVLRGTSRASRDARNHAACLGASSLSDVHFANPALVRAAIRAHLVACPLGADTPQGILANWLPGACPVTAELIGEVLAQMVRDQELCERPLPGGATLYLRGPRMGLAMDREQPDE